jgi:hypothetical protein
MGRQTGGIFRTTISVPKGLKNRMDAVAGQVNWSQVAVRAFEEKLAEIAAGKRVKNLEDAIQRLRVSKLRGEDKNWQRGYEAGGAWARGESEADELVRAAEFLAEVTNQPAWDWSSSEACGSAIHVLRAIRAEQDIDHAESAQFWNKVLGEKCPKGNLLYGFVCGASNFWAEIVDKL